LTEKNLKRSIAQCISDYETWKNRLDLAQKQNKQDLVDNAQEELTHFTSRLASLKAEFDSLTTEISQVKNQISQAFAEQRGRPSGTDPDQLLQALQSMAGKSAEETSLDRALKEQEADNELAELKQRLAGESKESS
jgi:chromosome segregation ATPase